MHYDNVLNFKSTKTHCIQKTAMNRNLAHLTLLNVCSKYYLNNSIQYNPTKLLLRIQTCVGR